MVLKVLKTESKDGIDFIIGTDATDKDSKTFRVNSTRFSWNKTSYEEINAAHALAAKKQQIVQEVTKIKQELTFQDHLKLVFWPRIIECVMWSYVDRCLKFCADNRISVFKKLSRTIKDVRKDYENELLKDLQMGHIAKINKQAEAWFASCAMEFTQMHYTITNAFYKTYQEVPQFMVDAFIAKRLIKLKRAHDAEMTEMLRERIGEVTPSVEIKQIYQIDCLLEGFLPDDLDCADKDLNTEIGFKVIKNKLNLIEWGED